MAIFEGRLQLSAGEDDRAGFHLDVSIPVFRYEAGNVAPDADDQVNRPRDDGRETMARAGAVTRRQVSTTRAQAVVAAGSRGFAVTVPAEAITGPDLQSFARWVDQVGMRGMSFPVQVTVTGGDGDLLSEHTCEVLYFVDRPSVRTEQPEPVLDEIVSKFFLVNAETLWRLLDRLDDDIVPQGTHQQVRERCRGFEVLEALAEIGDLVGGAFRARELNDDDRGVIANRVGLGVEVIDTLVKYFEQLTRFELTVPARVPLQVAGTFAVTGRTDLTAAELGFYHPVIDVPVVSGPGTTTLRSLEPDWPLGDDPQGLPLAFDWQPHPAVHLSTVVGPITIRIKGYDGVELWRRSYAATDDDLGQLQIVVDRYLPRPGTPAGSTDADGSLRRIRGQVVAMDPRQPVASLTVVVQARGAEDPNWRLVSAGQTDGSGYFALPYPVGTYVAAQALVSVAPDAPTDIGIIAADAEGATLAPDFLYLLLQAGTGADEECGCGGGHVNRLPDQADLIRSDEYTQDLGGGCVNVTPRTGRCASTASPRSSGQPTPTWPVTP